MAALNKVMLLGNVGQDPETRQTPTGRPVANFSVATTDAWGEGDDRQERTEWHQVVVWGKLAETCGQYLTKGRQVMVEGRLQTRSYADRDGNRRYTTEVVAQNVQFLASPAQSSRPSEASPPAPPAPADQAAAERAQGEAEYERAWRKHRAHVLSSPPGEEPEHE